MNERTIFVEALEIRSPDERAEYLDTVCAGDAELRCRVEALLTSHQEAGDFLVKFAPQRLAEAVAAGDFSDVTQDCDGSNIPIENDLNFLTPADNPNSLGRIGHYEIQEVIGRGGMGIVLRAFDERLHRIVAIKVMAAQLATSVTARKRFTREAHMAAAVNHDQVVTIHAVEEADGLPYIVMQYVAGLSLEERIQRDGPLQLHEILRIGMQTALGLAAAHAQGLIHRDIKPANILLENGVERVRITDFGLARVADDASLTQSGVVAGTPHYMAPEQARGDALDARTDLFSLGSVLYAMCTGRSPFRAGSSMAVLRRVCEDEPASIREINPEIPEWLVAIVEKLHAKVPAERFQSAAEVADLLGRHLAQVQHPSVVGEISRPPVERKPILRPDPRRRWVAAAAILLVCLFGGLSLTEATGVTSLRATVIRIFTPDGVLLVETDDPAVKVTVEGDGGLVITGAGLEEIRLRPGSYRVQADKNGQRIPLDQELVTVSRGDRAIVKVKLESSSSSAAGKGEKGAFVLLGARGASERKFDTLAEAVQGAGDGDTIEIRGNGPFVTEPVYIKSRALTIRAGEGYRPRFQLGPDGSKEFLPLLSSDSPLVLEGLEFYRNDPGDWTKPPGRISPRLIDGHGPVQVAHCRFVQKTQGYGIHLYDAPVSRIRHSEFLSASVTSWMGGVSWQPTRDGRLVVDNCAMCVGGTPIVMWHTRDGIKSAVLELSRNTLVGNTAAFFNLHCVPDKKILNEESTPPPFRIESSSNLLCSREATLRFDQAPGFLIKVEQPLDSAEAMAMLPKLLSWQEQDSLYSHLDPEFLTFSVFGQLKPDYSRVISLADWRQFWDVQDGQCEIGDVRFRSGDLWHLARIGPENVTAKDFRLHSDSAGYRAGPDGKDLGADVDLVGPGEAYERWKKTPEYQEWLKETGQLRAEMSKPEYQAFVGIAGAGIAERKFSTLAEAVQSASAGDTIEIRGNGPYLTDTVEVKHPLTIRAGTGYRPVLKRNPLDEEKLALLTTESDLIVEGLELQDLDNNPQRQRNRALLASSDAPLFAANCRFVSTWATNRMLRSPRIELRNCEGLCSWYMAAMIAWNDPPSRGTLRVQNCVSPNWGVFLAPSQSELADVGIELVGNSFSSPLLLSCYSGGELWNDGTKPKPFHIKATNNVLRTQSIFRVELNRFRTDATSWPLDRVEKLADSLLDWQGASNVFASGSGFELWHYKSADNQIGPTMKSLADWRQRWGGKDANAVEGEIRFQGGSFRQRVVATPYLITPQDFRLVEGSPGYRAGPDGKDLGADVDLVGPGEAYERWKKTPEYQEWLKETRQVE